MPNCFRLTHRVQFCDTDMAGIVHFANFFRYMEATEQGFLRTLGYSVHSLADDGHGFGFPRVSVSCDFRAPLRFEDEFEVQLLVREIKEKSLRYEFVFRKLGDEPPVEVARGSITTVCVTVDEETGRMRAIPVPEGLVSQLEVAAEE